MKIWIILLLMIPVVSSLDFNPDSYDFKILSVQKSDIITIKQLNLEVIRITQENLVLRTTSNSILLFNIGEEKSLDINKDKLEDINIKLIGINNLIAEIEITTLKNAISPSELEEIKTQFEEPKVIEETSSNLPIYITLSLVILIILSLIIFFIKKRKLNRYY